MRNPLESTLQYSIKTGISRSTFYTVINANVFVIFFLVKCVHLYKLHRKVACLYALFLSVDDSLSF